MTPINLPPHAALEYLTERARDRTCPHLITVSGGTCSGKTTLVTRVNARLTSDGFSTALVPLDEYYKDCDDPSFPQHEGSLILDTPEAYHHDQFVSHVRDLCDGKPIKLPHYDLRQNRRLPDTRAVEPADFIVAEGLFATHFLQSQATPAFHIFMCDSPHACLTRRIQRDIETYHVSVAQVTEAFRTKILPHWDLQYRYNQPHAHLMVES